ncbi:uncharacterized protein SAPINGB_P003873 [Magnusiomyces paraingens]|uniref:Large ribosomal subunit protein mL50 n=1 Tax=Magnusiomyces paraingens TaxID=2606893 RepID=A0A5E8BRP8_9ASCO|nr:uncharacterized protein SAPINGB_P003873 [Saprochaete ingens]VVT54033.1 unnamed protein product [Saprochaete ingens]
MTTTVTANIVRRAATMVQTRRMLHTTTPRALDLFSFFRSKQASPALKPVEVPKPKKTKELLSEIESGSASDVTQRQAPKLEVIGLPNTDESWSFENNGFSLAEAFPINTVAPTLDLAQVATAIRVAAGINTDTNNDSIEWMKSVSLLDFGTRLDFTKRVARELGVAIPDSRLAEIVDAHDLYNYFETFVAGVHFNPKEPDAIYLDPKDYEGTNITILPKPLSKGEQKKKWGRLVAQARKARDVEVKEQMDSAMN